MAWGNNACMCSHVGGALGASVHLAHQHTLPACFGDLIKGSAELRLAQECIKRIVVSRFHDDRVFIRLRRQTRQN